MQMQKALVTLVLAAGFMSAATAWAGKGYQVTGPIAEVTDTKIVVMKGKERWELAKSAATKVTGGDLKVGDKVTVYYEMTATDIEVKAGKK
jgi:hypothetical protein